MRGTFWGNDEPLYQVEALLLSPITNEALANLALQAGQDFFLFFGSTGDSTQKTQLLEEVKKLIANYFASLAKNHGVDVEGHTLFRLEKRIFTGIISRFTPGAPFWATVYETSKNKHWMEQEKCDPGSFIREREQAIK